MEVAHAYITLVIVLELLMAAAYGGERNMLGLFMWSISAVITAALIY